MPFRFSADGPSFPDALLDALLAGEVVFFCGAGVSLPQLPGFQDLVSETFTALDIEMEQGEPGAFADHRFEEVLGSLARRLIHPRRMYETVERLLSPPPGADTTRHDTLLRLSKTLDNRVCLVTTNFDPLFERALAGRIGPEAAAGASMAGQALPVPGAEDFDGVIHLHGRHADAETGISASPLVLTSSEYGDAYMRSGWASRFLFDLARCKTIVLVGFSAGDAPVRYFFNILEADRDRFSDLRPVYAFDGVETAADEADARWSTLAVQPLTYSKAAPGLAPHQVLYRDLEQLAVLVERPKPMRRHMAQTILVKRVSEASPDELDQLDWLLRNRGDLWDIVIQQIEDPAWFDHFQSRGLWQASDPAWVVPQWCARHWRSLEALHAAARWSTQPGSDLTEALDRLLSHLDPPPWRRAWRQLVAANQHRLKLGVCDGYRLASHVRAGPCSEIDLQAAVDLLTPKLVIEPPKFGSAAAAAITANSPLRDFYAVELKVRGDVPEGLLDALQARPEHFDRLIELATARRLRCARQLARLLPG